MHMLDLTGPSEFVAVKQILDREAFVVGQPPFPERDLEIATMRVMGVEIDGDEKSVGAPWRGLSVIKDIVVERVVEGYAQMRMKRGFLGAYPVQLGDFGDDVTGLREIALFQFILL